MTTKNIFNKLILLLIMLCLLFVIGCKSPNNPIEENIDNKNPEPPKDLSYLNKSSAGMDADKESIIDASNPGSQRFKYEKIDIKNDTDPAKSGLYFISVESGIAKAQSAAGNIAIVTEVREGKEFGYTIDCIITLPTQEETGGDKLISSDSIFIQKNIKKVYIKSEAGFKKDIYYLVYEK